MKNVKSVIVFLATAALMSACGGNNAKTGEAYGLVHGAGYVGAATVTVNGDKITGATLQEVCLPSYITISDDDVASYAEADYVSGSVTSHGSTSTQHWFKTVKFGSYTITAATTAEGALEYTGVNWTDEAFCKAYYKAVMDNTAHAETSTGNVVFGHEKLSKEENGYGGEKFNWKSNRDATVAAYVANGEKCLEATKQAEGTKTWVIGEVDTGATWTDFNTRKEGTFSYIELLSKAYHAA